jgi:hypothetical protein
MRIVRSPILVATLTLVGTGVLASAVVSLSYFLVNQHFPAAWVLAAGMLLAGLLGCLTLLSRGWRPLARQGGDKTFIATAVTAVLLVATMGIALMATAYIAGRLCPWNTAEICSLDAMLTVTTLGAIGPWILAGTPSLLILWLRAWSHRTSP